MTQDAIRLFTKLYYQDADFFLSKEIQFQIQNFPECAGLESGFSCIRPGQKHLMAQNVPYNLKRLSHETDLAFDDMYG